MKIIFVPAWVEQALESDERGIRAVLDQDVLKATLSREDVAFYVQLNRNMQRWLPAEIPHSFEHGTNEVLNLDESFMGEVSDLYLMRRDLDGDANLDTRELFGPLSSPMKASELKFTVRVLNYDTIAIVPQKDKGDSIMGMVDYLLLLLTQRMKFQHVARTPLFRYYVRLI